MTAPGKWSRWVWPAAPALVATVALAASDQVERLCPPYTTRLPPHPTLLGLGSKHAPVRRDTLIGAKDLPYYYEGDEIADATG